MGKIRQETPDKSVTSGWDLTLSSSPIASDAVKVQNVPRLYWALVNALTVHLS